MKFFIPRNGSRDPKIFNRRCPTEAGWYLAAGKRLRRQGELYAQVVFLTNNSETGYVDYVALG